MSSGDKDVVFAQVTTLKHVILSLAQRRHSSRENG